MSILNGGVRKQNLLDAVKFQEFEEILVFLRTIKQVKPGVSCRCPFPKLLHSLGDAEQYCGIGFGFVFFSKRLCSRSSMCVGLSTFKTIKCVSSTISMSFLYFSVWVVTGLLV